mgnify:CR=1 FL=1
MRKLNSWGIFQLNNVKYHVDAHRPFEKVLVVTDGDQIMVVDLNGEILLETTKPAPGITYVGSGRPPGTRPKNPGPSPKS